MCDAVTILMDLAVLTSKKLLKLKSNITT